jgi:hypothetical protein
MARSEYSSSSAPSPLPESRQRRQERRQLRSRSSSHQRPHRSAIPDNGMRSPLEDVTDIVLASEYYWSPQAWPQPSGRTKKTYNASIASTPTLQFPEIGTSCHRDSPGRKAPKRVSWADVHEEQYRPSTPPRTPQLGRLGTPDLELTRKCEKFCDCCSDEQKYNEDRSKMDSQSRSIRILSFSAGARRSGRSGCVGVVVRRRTGAMDVMTKPY